MTKVQITYKLSRPLEKDDLDSIAHLHVVYGLLAVKIQPPGDSLFVEYDASRLSPKEVRGTLEQNGIPLSY